MAISLETVKKRSIRNHYDISTLFYRMLWGPHIHHGYWEADESPQVAQLQLTEKMADLAQVSSGDRLIDIGCGMGGSTIHLARTRGAIAQGVTISPVQRLWASSAARSLPRSQRPTFVCEDAESLVVPEASMDVVWSIECTEHLFDKARFFQKAASWLRPGGRVAICAWLCGDQEEDPRTRRLVRQVCDGMLCPSLGTQQDYRRWMEESGLTIVADQRWTKQVLKTWELCLERVERSRVRWLAKCLGREHVQFLDDFQTILEAYRTGAMEYGCMVAVKPKQMTERG